MLHPPPPRDPGLHIRLFGYVVAFGQDFNGLVCTTRDMDAPNPMADPVMARYARQILEATPGSGPMDTVDSVRHILLVLLPSGECSVDQVAQQLGVDRRTVHRRLLREGTTFTDVVNTVRREMAVHYLEDGKRPLSQVAELLGFSALSAFSRWHKQQFGEVAGRRRRSEAAPPTRSSVRFSATPGSKASIDENSLAPSGSLGLVVDRPQHFANARGIAAQAGRHLVGRERLADLLAEVLEALAQLRLLQDLEASPPESFAELPGVHRTLRTARSNRSPRVAGSRAR